MKGKLVVIEACDASGKATQAEKLYRSLKVEKFNVKKVEYPNYKSDSSSLIKMYLNGDFGKDPGDVNPYVASTFYAVDRFASFKKEWEYFYNNAGIIIADRYTTSNMVHQTAKISEINEKNKFLDWLWDYEFNMCKLPIPDCVIFLDMPPSYSKELMDKRINKLDGAQEVDIHELNYDYLVDSYYNSLFVANKYNWKKISCIKEGKIRSIDEIHLQVYNTAKDIVNK